LCREQRDQLPRFVAHYRFPGMRWPNLHQNN
jgi:hypothetical protein